MRRSGSVYVAVLALAAVLGVFLFYKYQIPHKPLSTVPPPQLPAFQPEGQMLTQATKPGISLALASPAPAKTSPSKLPYAYQSSLCTQSDIGAHFSCLKDYYQQLVATYGSDVAFTDLEKRYQTDSFVVSECHPITHVIGREAAKKYTTVSEAYAHGNSFCWSGYYHGILEGFVARIGVQNLPSHMNTICADIPGKETYNFNYYNCVHGIGHGVMELNNDDVFVSLKLCDNLNGSWEKQSCYSGVYMQNIIDYDRDGFSDFLRQNEPLYPCTAVDTQYKQQCYLGQTSFALQVSGGDYKKVFAMCATVEGFRDICNQSMGRDIANYATHDPVITKNGCMLASESGDVTNCITGAVKEFISYYHDISQAKKLCAQLDVQYEASCSSTAESYYRLF